MTEPQPNPVSAAVWRWRESPSAGLNPRGHRRLRGVVQAAIMLAIAWFLAFRLGHRIPAAVLGGLAVLVVLVAATMPSIFDGFQKAVGRVAHAFGVALTWILLTPFFYVVFVSGRIALKLLGKDPLGLKFPADESTFWVPWRPPPTKEHYAKQYR